jgi:hypothetical protein
MVRISMRWIVPTVACSVFILAVATVVFADTDLFAPPDPDAMAPANLPDAVSRQPVTDTGVVCGNIDIDRINSDRVNFAGNNFDYNAGALFSNGNSPAQGEVQQCSAQAGSSTAPNAQPSPPPEADNSAGEQHGSSSGQTNPSCAPQNNSCGNSCCDDCCTCRNWWVQVDYLAMWIQANHLPPLVTTSPPGTPQSDAGVLPGARILYGDNYADGGARNGGRVTLGYWLDDDHTNGIEASWFTVGQPTGAANFFANSLTPGSPILARPFFNATTHAQDAQLISFTGPGLIVGGEPGAPASIGVVTRSSMDLAEFDFDHLVESDSDAKFGWIAGYRHLQFRESLAVGDNLIVYSAAMPPAPITEYQLSDQFKTNNDFEGGQLGAKLGLTRGPWTFDGAFKLAVGNVHEYVNINGSTTIIDVATQTTTQGPGLLAQPTNDGSHSRNEFAFLPEMELNFHYQLTSQIDLTVGYTFLYLTRVTRVGDQIDTSVSSTDLPTASGNPGAPGNHPAEVLRDTSMWAQGISGGIELRF